MKNDHLIVSHIPFALKMAKKCSYSCNLLHEADDMIGVAMLALVRAARKFHDDRDATFRTYATWVIRGALLDYARTRPGFHRGTQTQASFIDADDPAIQTTEKGLHTTNTAEAMMAAQHFLKFVSNDFEREILRLYFFEDHTLLDIARLYKVSGSYIHQTKEMALQKLRFKHEKGWLR